jgi:hypothetical protein
MALNIASNRCAAVCQRPGQKLATYQISTSGSLVYFALT